jgi:hypothetical protein
MSDSPRLPRDIDVDDDELFDSPEEAALSTWVSTPSAHARVISISIEGDEATVMIKTDSDHDDYNTERNWCTRERDGKWFASGSTG